MTKTYKKGPENLKNQGLEGVWELLGATLRQKNLLKAVLADFGQFWPGSDRPNLAQMGQDGANLEPRWRQEPPSWGQDGHLEAIWGVFFSIFGGLGSDL